MTTDDLPTTEVTRQIKAGNCRAVFTASALRSAGLKVEMVQVATQYKSGVHFHFVPFAPAWAVVLAMRLRRYKVGYKLKRAALVEARELGKPGPLAEAVFVAGELMGGV